MNIAVVLSGGQGLRLSRDIPKQYIIINGNMVITYCLMRIFSHAEIEGVWIVAEESWRETIREAIDHEMPLYAYKFQGFSMPGETRQLSIFNAINDAAKALKAPGEDIVLIHDAARPCVSAKQISDCLEACKEHDGAMPVLPMKDTVYLSRDGKSISELIDRSSIFAGQAPEAFRLEKYLEANKILLPDRILRINGSTEPAVMFGMDVAMIEGDENNYKITTPGDLERFEASVPTLPFHHRS